jgi:hypothetical protein
MPYLVICKIQPLTELNREFQAGIWVPPPSDGSSPGTPNNVATVSSDPDPKLTFPTLGGPPSSSAMRVWNLTGDLFRSGAIGSPLPNPPAPLAVFSFLAQQSSGHTITQSDLDKAVKGLPFGSSFPVPFWVQALVGVGTSGYFIPRSAKLLTATLALPPSGSAGTLSLNITGTILVSHWDWWTTTNPFTFAMTLGLSASADPVDTSRIFAATGSSPSLGVSGLPGLLVKPVADWMTSVVASTLEGPVNQLVASAVIAGLANLPAPLQNQMLTPTAVMSAARVTILSSGIDIVIAIGDIFGPGIIPIEGNMTNVPNVSGLDVPTAEQAVIDAHLSPVTKRDGISDLIDVPTVVMTTPSGGTQVPKETTVYLIVEYPRSGSRN